LCYALVMATTTVRLDPDEEHTLDEMAEIHGGRSNALRAGLRLLATETQRRGALNELLADWQREAGQVDDDEVAAMTDRLELDS
jgi:Arc/MetJ-type ribon-helix-helix transcriptional regulator